MKKFRFTRGPYKGLTIRERDDAREKEWAERVKELEEEREEEILTQEEITEELARFVIDGSKPVRVA